MGTPAIYLWVNESDVLRGAIAPECICISTVSCLEDESEGCNLEVIPVRKAGEANTRMEVFVQALAHVLREGGSNVIIE
jgi:hypothetical protein